MKNANVQTPDPAGEVLEERGPHPRPHRHTQVRLLPQVRQEQVLLQLPFIYNVEL